MKNIRVEYTRVYSFIQRYILLLLLRIIKIDIFIGAERNVIIFRCAWGRRRMIRANDVIIIKVIYDTFGPIDETKYCIFIFIIFILTR